MDQLTTAQKRDIMYHWRFPDGFRFSSPEQEQRWRIRYEALGNPRTQALIRDVDATLSRQEDELAAKIKRTNEEFNNNFG